MAENLSRAFLLRWLGSIGIHISRVEDIGTGAPLCACLKQLNCKIGKYKEVPKNEWEYLDNLKIVKEYFASEGVKVHLPIERMCKLKLQDNLEVLQWFYKYYEMHRRTVPDPVIEQSSKPEELRSQPCVEITSVVVENPSGSRTQLKCSKECAKQTALLKKFVKILKKERDFYFSKLILIEQLILGNKHDIVKDEILNILYDDSETGEKHKKRFEK